MATTPNYPSGYFVLTDSDAADAPARTLEVTIPAASCAIRTVALNTGGGGGGNTMTLVVEVDGEQVISATKADSAGPYVIAGSCAAADLAAGLITLTDDVFTWDIAAKTIPMFFDAGAVISVVITKAGGGNLTGTSALVITGIQY
jgi:hypothetical protein